MWVTIAIPSPQVIEDEQSCQLGEGGSVQARGGQSEGQRGIPERLKARVWGGRGMWLGGRGGGVGHGWGWGGGETTEVRLSSGQVPNRRRGPDKQVVEEASCGVSRVTWAQREQSGQHWDTPQGRRQVRKR